VWSSTLIASSGCAVHASVERRGPLPLLLNLVIVAIATPDRVPFEFSLGLGCPNYLAHLTTAYLLSSCYLTHSRCRTLRVHLTREEQRGLLPPASSSDDSVAPALAVYFEILPIFCAALSNLYLYACW
jgi:hypothetical protein